MSIKEEQLQILKMIEEGKVTHEEAMALLEALGGQEDRLEGSPKKKDYQNRMLRIRVREGNDKVKVNVNLPLSLVSMGLNIAKQFNMGDHQEVFKQIDMHEIIRLIDEGAQGKLLEVEDVASNTTVEIYVD